jgi:hypothetical protein
MGNINFHGRNTVRGNQTIAGRDVHQTIYSLDASQIEALLDKLRNDIEKGTVPIKAGAEAVHQLEAAESAISSGSSTERSRVGRYLMRAKEILAITAAVPQTVEAIEQMIKSI